MREKLIQSNLKNYSAFLAIFLIATSVIATEVPITPFPLEKYSQNINDWINPESPDYNKPVMSISDQKNHLDEYYNHYYATGANASSPWSSEYVIKNAKIPYSEQELINKYGNSAKTNQEKIGYGENFHPYSDQWIKDTITNMNLAQLKLPIEYNPNNRGIAVKNLLARDIPTIEPYFYKFSLAGEGYPFDIIQESAIWVGTPVYIIGQTLDQQWYLVLTPQFIEWVQSEGIAKTSKDFIKNYQECAKQKMVAITRTNVSVLDTNKQYQFNAYIGAVFPGANSSDDITTIKVLIPTADTQHNAQIAVAELSNKDAAIMPLEITPHNFATVISTLLGRPYGWGNMYFYNDCSAELQNLYTPFGILLQRNSSSQEKAGKTVIDKSSADMQERLNYIMENGKKFTTITSIGGHVMLYIGSYPNPNSDTHEPMAMTYQNIWGLRPADNSYRAVIGRAVLFPLLPTYPEDPNLISLADRKFFKLIYLADDLKDPQYEDL
ncbi:conserved hypothetical protein [Gammaproteobacteria bacterium]